MSGDQHTESQHTSGDKPKYTPIQRHPMPSRWPKGMLMIWEEPNKLEHTVSMRRKYLKGFVNKPDHQHPLDEPDTFLSVRV